MTVIGTSGSSFSPAPVGGRRHHKSAKRVSAKTIRRTLKRLGMRPKGRLVLKGGDGGDGVVVNNEGVKDNKNGGRRRRHGGRSASASMSSNKKGKRSRRRSKRALSIPGLGKLPF